MAIQFLNDQYISGTLQVAGAVTFDTAVNPGSDTDKFAVLNGSVLGFRTGAEILSDIGAASSATSVTSVTGTQPIISSGGLTPTISLNYTGSDNFIESATDLEGVAIATTDSIIYNDATDGNVKMGLVSDLPYSATTGTVTSITPGADSGTGTAITTSGTITVAGGSNITTSVSGTTITVNTDFNQYGWTLSGDTGSNSIPSGSTVDIQGGTGITTSLTSYTLDVAIDSSVIPSGSGTSGKLAKWTGTNTLGDGPVTISGSDATFAGNVVSEDTFYLENGSGNRWQMLFDTNDFNLRYYNGTSWSADAFAIDTSNNATFAGSVTANTGSKITSSSADTTLSIETTTGTTIFPILDFVSSHSTVGGQIRQGGTSVIGFDKSLNATFAGNVGIGGTLANKKLYVLGDTTNYQILAEQPSGYAGLSIKSTTVAQTWSWLANDNGSNSDLLLYGGAAAGTKLTIDSSGKVGIGGSPSYLLDVNKSSAGANVDLRVYNSETANAASGARGIIATAGASAGDPRLVLAVTGVTEYCIGIDNSDSDKLKIGSGSDPSSGSTYLTIDASGATFAGDVTVSGGNLGVGMAASSYAVEVETSGNNGIKVNTGTSGAEELYMGNTGGEASIGTITNHNVRIIQNGAAAISIDTSKNATFAGKVGIGSAPSSRGLEVSGAGGLGTILASDGTVETVLWGDATGTNIGGVGTNNNYGFTIYQNGGDAISIDTSKNATFAGQVLCNTNTTTPTSGDAAFYKSSAGAVVSGYQAILETGSAGSRATGLTLDASQNATFAGTVSGTTATFTTFSGDLNGTINTATTAVTKGNAVNDTTVATTAFVQNVVGTIPAGLVFQGTWNASTNTPTLASGTGTTGNFYIVSVAGSTNLDGVTDWEVGDWAVFIEQGASDQWEKIDNSSVLGGSGSGGSLTAWAGSGTSVTLTDAPVTYSGNDTTFAGDVNVTGTANITSNIVHQGDTNTNFGFPANDTIQFQTAANPRMTINPTGNVGIGTSSPANKLHIETDTSTVYDGDANQTGGLFVNNIYHEALNTFSQIRLGVSGASGASTVRLVGIEPSQAASDFAIVLRNGSVWGEKLRIKGATGNVGIGTTSPSSYNSRGQNLVISGAGDVGISIDCSSANSGSMLFADGTGGTAGYRGIIEYDHGDDSMAFSTAATETLSLNSDQSATFAGDVNLSNSSGSFIYLNTDTGAADTGLFLTEGSTANKDQNGFKIYYSGSANTLNIDSGTTSLTNRLSIARDTGNATFAGNIRTGTSNFAENPNFDNIVIEGPAHTGMTIFSGTGSDGAIYFGDSSAADGQGQIKYAHGSNAMTFTTNDGAASLTLDSGLNATFAGNLIIHNGSNAPYIDFVESGAITDSKARITMDQVDTNNGQLLFSTEGGGTLTERMRIDSAGNVGIGVTAPQQKLTLGSVSAGGIQFNYDATDNYRHQILNYWNSNADSRMDFNIARTSAETPVTTMSVGYNTNVGIGTTTPAKRLSIYNSATTNTAQLDIQDGSSGAHAYLGTFSNNMYLTFGGTYSSGWASDGTRAIAGIVMSSAAADSNISFQTTATNNAGPTTQMTITKDGNVGIGTTGPTYKLDVVGNGRFSGFLEMVTGGAVYQGQKFYLDGGGDTFLESPSSNIMTFTTNAVEKMRIDSSGNVGIGVTPETGMVTYIKQLRIGEQSGFQGHADSVGQDSATWVTTNYKFGTSGAEFINGTAAAPGYAMIYQQQVGEHTFGTSNTTGVAGGAITVTNQMTIKQSGNVGIGTTAPSSVGVGGTPTVLQINNSSTSVAQLVLSNQSTADGAVPGVIDFASDALSGTEKRLAEIWATKGDASTSVATGSLSFATNNAGTLSERMRITSAGNVGIGTTSNSWTEKLTVESANGTAYTSVPQIRVSSKTGNNRAAILFTDSALSDGKISYYPHATEAIRFFSISARLTESDFIVKGDGNVGIGTTSPESKLAVKGASTAADLFSVSDIGVPTSGAEYGTAMIKTSYAGYALNITNYSGAGKGLRVYTTGDTQGEYSLYCDQAGTAAFVVDAIGKVGIGDTAPPEQFCIKDPSGGFRLEMSADNNPVTIMSDNLTGAAYGEMAFLAGNGSGANDITRMKIDASGNVGIGTTSPDAKLDVEAAHSQLRLTDSDDSKYALFSFSSTYLSIRNNSTSAEHFSLDSSGNVGIGTNSPDVKLQIINSDSTQNILSLANQNDSTLAFDFGRVVSTGALSIQGRQTGYNNILLAPTSGNVGIGVTAPGAKLDIVGASDGSPILKLQRSGIGAYQYFVTDIGAGAQQLFCDAQQADSGFVFRTRNASNTTINALYMDPDGNVGIGTASPAYKLDVNGALYTEKGSVMGSLTDTTENNPALTLNIKSGSENLRLADTDTTTSFGPYISFWDLSAGLRRGFISCSGGQSSGRYDMKVVAEYGEVQLWTGASNNEAKRVTVTSAGNVGIGYDSPSKALSVNGGIIMGANGTDAGASAIYGDIRRPDANTFCKRNYKLNAGSTDTVYYIARQWHDSANWGSGGINVIQWGVYYGRAQFNKADFMCRYGYGGNSADIETNFNPGSMNAPVWGSAVLVTGNIYYRDLTITIPAYEQWSFEIINPGALNQTYDISNTAQNYVYFYPH